MLLDTGASLTKRDPLLRSTPLGWAGRWGRIGLVRLHLERGADALETDAEQWATPLSAFRFVGDFATMYRSLGSSPLYDSGTSRYRRHSEVPLSRKLRTRHFVCSTQTARCVKYSTWSEIGGMSGRSEKDTTRGHKNSHLRRRNSRMHARVLPQATRV